MASVATANVPYFVNKKYDCITSANVVEAANATRFMTIVKYRLPDVSSTSTPR
jgi:hypothetical protein